MNSFKMDPCVRAAAQEIADEAVGHFSTLHPHIRMNKAEWSDLHEMIEREVWGHFEEGSEDISAADLLPANGKAFSQSPAP